MLDTAPTLTGDPWDAMGVFRYGTEPIRQAGARAVLPHVQSSTPDVPLWSPQHPLFWFAAVLVATGTGLFAVSGSVRVAKTKASASIAG